MRRMKGGRTYATLILLSFVAALLRRFGNLHVSTYPTDDGKYLGTTIYNQIEKGPVDFSVYVREE